MSKIGLVIQAGLITFFLAVGGLIYTINREFDEALKPVTDPDRYSEIRAKFEDSLPVKHFYLKCLPMQKMSASITYPVSCKVGHFFNCE